VSRGRAQQEAIAWFDEYVKEQASHTPPADDREFAASQDLAAWDRG